MHIKGDVHCERCCCGPERCDEDNCTGLVHIEVVDEIDIGDDYEWVHNLKCDTCSFEQTEDQAFPILFKEDVTSEEEYREITSSKSQLPDDIIDMIKKGEI